MSCLHGQNNIITCFFGRWIGFIGVINCLGVMEAEIGPSLSLCNFFLTVLSEPCALHQTIWLTLGGNLSSLKRCRCKRNILYLFWNQSFFEAMCTEFWRTLLVVFHDLDHWLQIVFFTSQLILFKILSQAFILITMQPLVSISSQYTNKMNLQRHTLQHA